MDEKDYKKANEERNNRIKDYAVKIGMAFLSAVEELLRVIRGFALPDEGVMFSFDSLPQAKRSEVEKRLRHLHSVAKAITEDGMKAEWLKSEEFNDELVKQMTGVVKGNPELAGWFDRNNQARNAFINRKVNGLNLSDRIWKTVKQLREEMEVAVTVSMGEGESAASMSRKVRNYLNDPDLMFRRFRYKAGEDEEGNPIYRKKWKKRVKDEATGRYKFEDYDKDSYKVGRGYYKSSTMNAMRVTRTETNMAYRMADHDRWQRLDFVLGQRIKTSRSHKDEDICDDLAGDYPKDFTFTGWHPQCMCYCTPIMLEPKEVFRMSRAKLEGKPIKPSRGPLTEYPEGFKKWVAGNSKYIARKRAEGKEPYFVRDNADVVNDILGITRMRDLGAKVDAIFKPNEINTYASFEPFSPMIMKAVSEAKGRKERRRIFESIMEDERAKMWPQKWKGRTVEFPGHRGRSAGSWAATAKAIEELNEGGIDVALLPELKNGSSADALIKIGNSYYISDFKMSTTKADGSLSKELKEGFRQAGTIILKLFNMDKGSFVEAVRYLKRNDIKYGNILLMNEYGKHLMLTEESIQSGKFEKLTKGFL